MQCGETYAFVLQTRRYTSVKFTPSLEGPFNLLQMSNNNGIVPLSTISCYLSWTNTSHWTSITRTQ